MTALAAFQAAFASDLVRAPEERPISALADQPGFAVYRNTVMTGCVAALAANYPTVRQLLGDAWFNDLGRDFVRRSPPCNGVLARYGEGFASFVETSSAAELAYLPAIAVLDRCWTEAHLAADAPVLSPVDFAGLVAERFGTCRLVLHPAARWQTFASMPAFTIWRRHRERLAIGDELDWHGESALLARPGAAVNWCQIDDAAATFLSACNAGRTLVESLDSATGAAEEPAAWLPGLLHAGAFSRIAAADE